MAIPRFNQRFNGQIVDTRTVDARPGGEARIHAGYAERKACFFYKLHEPAKIAGNLPVSNLPVRERAGRPFRGALTA